MKGSLISNSPWYQLFIIFLLAIGGTFVFLLIGIALVPLFFPFGLAEVLDLLTEMNSDASVELLKFLQGFNTLGTFLFPGLLGAYLISRSPSAFLRINSFPSNGMLIIILTVVLTLSGVTISDGLYRLSSQLEFPEVLKGLETYLEQTESLMKEQISSFVKMDNFLDFAEVFIIMALLPAVCEETLFRGVVQPLFIKGFGNIHIGIIVTSVIFGVLHQQFYSFLSIMALSIVLGYLRVWSKSLWVPVVMHLVNNGSIVVGIYFFDLPLEDMDSSAAWDPGVFWSGIIVFALSLYIMYRLLHRKEGKEAS